MPVTIRPSPQQVGENRDPVAASSADLLRRTSVAWTVSAAEIGSGVETNKKVGPEDCRVLCTSFTDLDSEARPQIIPYGNALVDGVLRAFQQDLRLVRRADDVWLADPGPVLLLRVLAPRRAARRLRDPPGPQAALHRHQACDAAGRRHRRRRARAGRPDARVPGRAGPARVTAPVLHHHHGRGRRCGRPGHHGHHEALLPVRVPRRLRLPLRRPPGRARRLADLLHRMQRFTRYGDEPAVWVVLLTKVLERMVASFDRPDAPATRDFWLRAAHAAGQNGSLDFESLSGWVTAFCFWNEDGKRVYAFADAVQDMHMGFGGRTVDRKRLVLDGVAFPIIARTSVPKSVAEVPAGVLDEGTGCAYETTVVAGPVGMMLSTSGSQEGGFTRLDTVAPRAGWWML